MNQTGLTQNCPILQRRFGSGEILPQILHLRDRILSGGNVLAAQPPDSFRTLACISAALAGKGLTAHIIPEKRLSCCDFPKTDMSLGILDIGNGKIPIAEAIRMASQDNVRMVILSATLFNHAEWQQWLETLKPNMSLIDHFERVQAEIFPDNRTQLQILTQVSGSLVICLDTPDPIIRDRVTDWFPRGNLHMEVSGWSLDGVQWEIQRGGDPEQALAATLGRIEGSVVIYAWEDAGRLLQYLHTAGFPVEACNSSDDVPAAWQQGESQVLLASMDRQTAINGPPAKAVLHFGCPTSLARYYQHVATVRRSEQCLARLFYHPDERYRFERDLSAKYPPVEHVTLAHTLVDDRENPTVEEALTCIGSRLSKVDARAAVDYLYRHNTADIEHLTAALHRARADALERWDNLEDYVLTPMCRLRYLLDYFEQDEAAGECGVCDNCRSRMQDLQLRKYDRRQLEAVVTCVAETREKFGRSTLVAVLRGMQSDTIRRYGLERATSYGAMKSCSRAAVDTLLKSCMGDELLTVRRGTYPTLALTETGRRVIAGHAIRELRLPKQYTKSAENFDAVLFEALRTVRTTLAERHHLPTFVIASDRLLQNIAQTQPETIEDLAAVKGVGPETVERFGEAFLKAVNDYREQRRKLGGA
jgi:hypothetical protein